MAIKDVTPIMTSNTTPEPYKVSCSGQPWDYCAAWKAFDGTDPNVSDYWNNGSCESGWIAMDFGSIVEISGVALTSVSNVGSRPSFENFEVHGSMDGIEWEIISYFNEGISGLPKTKKTFSFGKKFNYRHYRIYIHEPSSGHIAIAKINFICDTSITEKKLNFYKTLSKNVPNSLGTHGNEIHFTERGEIFTYSTFGNKVELGNLGSNITKYEW